MVTKFTLLQPQSLTEALLMAAQQEEALFLAGGTDILVALDNHKIAPPCLISLAKIKELGHIRLDNKGNLHIGSMATIDQIARDNYIRERYTALSQAAAKLGSWQIRNLATIGGNLCNGAPSAETAPSLLAWGAKAVMSGLAGDMETPLADFWRGPGQTVLAKGSLLKEIVIPAVMGNSKSVYLRQVIRRSIDISLANMAAVLETDDGGRVRNFFLALGAVAPTPLLLEGAAIFATGKLPADIDVGAIAEFAAREANPISDIRATAWYRRELVKVLVRRGLAELGLGDGREEL